MAGPHGRWTRAEFERQTETFLPGLFRAAYRLSGHKMDAEDLVQDTYVKAFRAFPKAELTSAEDCRAWLFRILVNTFRDQYRRRARSPVKRVLHTGEEGVSNIVDLVASADPSPATLAHQRAFAEAAERAIAALSPELKIVVTLFFVEGLSYRHIAAATGTPIGTVMSRLARGRRILREALRDYADFGDENETLPPAHGVRR